MNKHLIVRRGATSVMATAALIAVAACASQPAYQSHHGDQDANGDVRNQSRDDAGSYAHRAPPSIRQENPAPQPGPQYVWVEGHYSWDGNDFQWHGGQWAVPPTGFQVWVVGHWDQVGSSNWSYTQGRWQ